MGSDKALLPFGDFKTLTEYQIARLQPFFESLHVSTKKREKFDFDASFIEDIATYKEHSPLVALLSILTSVQKPVCVLSVDTPFVSPEIFQTLFQSLEEKSDAVIAVSPSSSHPLCAIYTPSLITKIENALQHNEHKMRHLLEQSTTCYVQFGDDTPFLNLNHPEDYAHAKERL